MKQWTLLLLTALLFVQCSKDDEDVLFEIPFQIDFEIPAGWDNIITHGIRIVNIPSNLEALLSSNGVNRMDIKSVNPKSATMTILNSSGEFDFVREVSVNLFDNTVDREVYFHPQVPTKAGDRLDLAGTLVDAQRYLLEPTFNMDVEFLLREVSPRFLNVRLRYIFVVRGN